MCTSEFAGVGPRVYVGMPLLLSRKGAVVRRAGDLLFRGKLYLSYVPYILVPYEYKVPSTVLEEFLVLGTYRVLYS